MKNVVSTDGWGRILRVVTCWGVWGYDGRLRPCPTVVEESRSSPPVVSMSESLVNYYNVIKKGVPHISKFVITIKKEVLWLSTERNQL